jgi:FtsP/CotA-like multicopper oxidase with cupredoxin domain
MEISRRTFLKAGAAALMGASMPAAFSSPARAGQKKTVRDFYFSASQAKVNLGAGPDFIAWTYNGRIPGPEIRVKEGEIIRVVLKNYLPEGTTIHWHGIPIVNAMDGVPGVTQEVVKPGDTFVYEFEAKPAGTYLYHSHAKYQLDQGLYGPLIIEPSKAQEFYDREFSLVLEDWVMQDGGGTAQTRRRPPMGRGMMGGMMGGRMGGMMGGMRQPGPGADLSGAPLLEPYYDGYAVNGRLYPAVAPLEVKKGDRVKLRLMNASSATIYYLQLAGHVLSITHTDGNPIQPIETDVLRIGMGERYEVMFTANNPGHWLLAAGEEGFGEGQLRVPIRYHGVQQKEPAMPDFQPGLRLAGYENFQALNPIAPRQADSPKFFEQLLSGGMHSPLWSINNQLYPDADPLLVRNGDRVRLSYRNQSMMPHPMHLHGHFFRVVNPALPSDLWVLKDTLIVDPMRRMEVEFIAENPGRWFHHCHNLYHMEAGMANVMVYQQ